MMWPMQMGSSGMGGMMMPPMGMVSLLHVRVDGIKFDYQLTEDDVRTVFSRYGDVFHVTVDPEGTAATVQFGSPMQAMAAQQDLDRKQLAGMAGASLRVEFASKQLPGGYDAAFAAQMMSAAAQQASFGAPPMSMFPQMPAGFPGMPRVMPGSPMGMGGGSKVPGSASQKKHTCKIEVGIENESEFRVGSRVIQIARHIWQEYGGKTRLRGKGCGGPHEADEPLALCISNPDPGAFNQSVAFAEAALAKIQGEYKTFCEQNGRPIPELAVKVSKRGSGGGGGGGVDTSLSRGEKPPNAPTDDEIERCIEERNEYRKATNYKKADEVRIYLKERGVVLMDEKGAKGKFQGNEITKWRYWRP